MSNWIVIERGKNSKANAAMHFLSHIFENNEWFNRQMKSVLWKHYERVCGNRIGRYDNAIITDRYFYNWLLFRLKNCFVCVRSYREQYNLLTASDIYIFRHTRSCTQILESIYCPKTDMTTNWLLQVRCYRADDKFSFTTNLIQLKLPALRKLHSIHSNSECKHKKNYYYLCGEGYSRSNRLIWNDS